MRRCKVCGERYEPTRQMQVTCGIECALIHGRRNQYKTREKQAKADRKETRERKERIKTRADWMREAQAAVNAYVRERDKDRPCISCGRYHQGQYHAGHYLSRGSHPELALCPDNIHKQCQPCNTHLSGNQINYRKGLIQRCGIELVEWLEGPHEPAKYTIDDLRALRDGYREKLRQIKKSSK